MMPNILPGWWVLIGALLLVVAVFIFGGLAWGFGVFLGLAFLFVAFVLFILSNTRFT